jgi:outer membrane lipase/esterase
LLRTLFLTTTALVALTAATNVYAAAPYTSEVVFGDSLSDDGNLSLASGSPVIMKFTTNPGNVTVENLAASLGLTLSPSVLGGTDYAFGGAGVLTNAPGTPAGVPTETAQITGYLASSPKISSSTLYTVWGGANDIFYAAASSAGYTAAQALIAQNTAGLPAAYVAAVTAQINAAVEAQAGVTTLETATQALTNVDAAAAQELTLLGALKTAGAKNIVVFNLPDIGTTPEATAAGPAGAAGLTALTVGYNTVLNSGLTALGVGIIPVNTFALIHEVVANPAAFGFVNVTTPACTTASSLMCTRATLVNPTAYTNYLFADGVHPTTAADVILNQYIVAELAAPQQESLLAEAPLAYLTAEQQAVGDELLYDQAQNQTGVRLFATGGYAHQSLHGQTYSPDGHSDDGVFTVGADWRYSEAVSFGAELTGATGTEDLANDGKFTTNAIMGSLFGQYQFGHVAYVDGSVGLGQLEFHDIQRTLTLGTLLRVEHGSTSGTTADAHIAAGYWFGPQNLHTGPYIAATYDRVRVESFGETGGDSSAMTFGAQTREAMIGEVGWKFQAAVPTGFAMLYPFATVGYDYDAKATTREINAGLTTMNGTFDMPGFAPSKSWGTAEVGVNAQLNRSWSAFAAYSGRFGDSSQGYNGGQVGVKYSF